MDDFIPDGYVPLSDALHRTTAAIFEDKVETALDLLDSIKLDRFNRAREELNRLKLGKPGRKRTVSPKTEWTAQEIEEIRAISIRFKEFENQRTVTTNKLRQWLFSGILPSFVLSDLGSIISIPTKEWGREGATKIFSSSKATFFSGFGRTSIEVSGRVLIVRADLEAVLDGKSVQKRDAINEREIPEYIPPYLAFMLRAVRELPLTPGTREKKETVIEWIKDNWSPEFGKLSTRKIDSMATFLRHPEDEKGGHLKTDRKS